MDEPEYIEQAVRRFGITLRHDDIGERLMELRRTAWDRYGCTALWYLAGHATLGSMRAVARGLQSNGDLAAARLAAEILSEVERQERLQEEPESHAT